MASMIGPKASSWTDSPAGAGSGSEAAAPRRFLAAGSASCSLSGELVLLAALRLVPVVFVGAGCLGADFDLADAVLAFAAAVALLALVEAVVFAALVVAVAAVAFVAFAAAVAFEAVLAAVALAVAVLVPFAAPVALAPVALVVVAFAAGALAALALVAAVTAGADAAVVVVAAAILADDRVCRADMIVSRQHSQHHTSMIIILC